MHGQSYLIFQINHSSYGVPAESVQEIFFLPKVTEIADVAPGILGVINLRGELIPVMDLHERLGQTASPLQLTDSVIVLEWHSHRVGIIVNQVDAVQSIASTEITVGLYSQSEAGLQDELVNGIATVEDKIITLLNPEQLVKDPTVGADFHSNGSSQKEPINNRLKHPNDSVVYQGLYHHFDAQAQQVLRERAAALQSSINNQDSAGLMPLAIVGLGGELFGFELEAVHEFTEIHKITPIPCCPPHIVGNINLRGEIITLINIHDVVALPMKAVRSQPQAVVVRLDQRVAGIAVDDIFDVTYIHPSQVSAPPLAMHGDKDDFLQGIAPYQERMMSIINLSKLLTSEALTVNEEV